MSIDPMAAVSTVTESAGSSAAGAGQAASPSATSTPQNAPQAPAAEAPAIDDSAKADLFDYSATQQHQPPAIETLAPESQAKYLSNPAALGEKVLEQMEGLHQRSLDYHNRFGEAGSTEATSSSTGGDTMAGPAAQDVAGSATSAATNNYSGLKLMFDYAAETRMISMTSSQFVSAINTLMKGQ